jgi:hypothetical protein
MEILSFIVGAGMVVGILAVVFAVRFYKEFQTLKGQYQYHLEDYTNTRRDMWEQMGRLEQDAVVVLIQCITLSILSSMKFIDKWIPASINSKTKSVKNKY